MYIEILRCSCNSGSRVGPNVEDLHRAAIGKIMVSDLRKFIIFEKELLPSRPGF